MLNGLNSLTESQAKVLCKGQTLLVLDGLTSITDRQAKSLSNVLSLSLDGLTAITDRQTESLSKVETLYISDTCRPLIDKYKKP